MINNSMLDELNTLGFGADVDSFESYVESLQDAAGLGKPMVTDTVYDHYIRMLKELKPESKILFRNWETEDNDYEEGLDSLLKKYGMHSITTVQTMTDLNRFKTELGENEVDLIGTCKLNGHAVRAVYCRGSLVSGSTRGRYKKGRDITRHLKGILPNYVQRWEDIPLVEVRGEVLVSLETFETIRYMLKTPLSSVTSLIRDSATDEDIRMMSFVGYKILCDEDLGIRSLWDELSHLRECGFEIPQRAKIEGVNRYNLEDNVETFINHFESLYENGELKYDTDGIVVAIDSLESFYEMGLDGNAYLGNFALKMGRVWESNIYCSVILDVEFVYGKSYITPKAIVEPVVTVTGSTVETVPLYNVGVMERLSLTPGSKIYFKFGGETGVTLVQEDGSPVSKPWT